MALQVAVAVLNLALASFAAGIGCAIFAVIMHLIGAHITVTSTAYVVSALIAASNPLIAIFGVLLLPVRWAHDFIVPSSLFC